MRKSIGLFAVLVVFLAGHALAQDEAPVVPPPTTVTPLPPGTDVRPFGFSRLVVRLAPGQIWATPRVGPLCVRRPSVPWESGQQDIRGPQYLDDFRTEMTAAGFKVDGAGDSIFEEPYSSSDMQVGGVFAYINIDYCAPRWSVGDISTVKGRAVIHMQWQIYSVIQKGIVARIDTQGGMEWKRSITGGYEAMIHGAFRENVRALIASETFRKTFVGTPGASDEVSGPASQPIISLPGSLAAKPRPIADAVASVVLIQTGGGMGSGFLVSSDGLVVTAAHVIGEAKLVKVRWSDGAETTGEVVRSSKIRDVALVKTDARGRLPLSVRLDPLRPGDGVFAIGGPLEQALQNTVTHGVVSAYRKVEGLVLIQSDVFINHGSSGGPLLDEHGAVIGISESIYRPNGEAESINFFTPIGDALAFLGAERK
jgi:serine protease Do